MKRKKGILLIALLVLLLGTTQLVASGGKEEKVDDGQITLSVWSWLSNDHEDGFESYTKIFNNFEEKNPNIKIDFTPMPYPTFWDSWRNATIAGVGPDVVSMYGGSTSGAYANSLLPLQDIISEDVIDNLKYVEPSYSPNGNLYLIPTGAYAYCLMLNNNILDKVGLDAYKDFSTWDDFLNSMQVLRSAGIRPFSTGFSDGYALEGLMYVFLTQVLDDNKFDLWVKGKLPTTDPAFKAAMEYVLEMNEAGAFLPDTLGKNLYYEAYEDMIAGKSASMIVGGLYYPIETEKAHGDGSVSIIPFPQVRKSNYENISDAGPNAGWSISAWTKKKDAAVKLVEHMASPESQMILWEDTQAIPNSKSLDLTSDVRIFSEYLDILSEPKNRTT